MRAAGATHAGLQRDQNEDRLLVDAARGLFCVVDGVGGHPGGERASAIALGLIETRLDRETGTSSERLREAIALANNAILDEAQRNPSLAGMTCVLTAAIVAGQQLTVGHVGDTRIYKLRHGHIQKLTRDHSPVGEREDAGELTETEAMRHPRRNEVYRDVGAQPHTPDDEGFVEIVETTFELDAALILCSDGLSDQVSSMWVRRIVEAQAGDPAAAVQELIHAANDAGGKDNVTVVVVEGPAFARSAHDGAAKGPPVTSAVASAGALSRWRAPLLVAAGIVLSVLAAVAAAWYLAPALLPWTTPPAARVETPGPRTWRVGLDAGADAASIAEALSGAHAGDTLRLSPGDYREAIVIAQPLTIDGPREAVIRPPLGAAAPWTAITVTGATGVTLAGFRIAGAAGQPVATGILIERGEVAVRNVAVEGATDAAIALGPTGRATIAESVIHDNPGVGIRARRGSRLALRHSTVLRNGTVPGRLMAGVQLDDGVEASLIGNAIGDNGSAAITGWPADALAALVRDNLVRPLPRPPPRRAPATVAPAPTPPGPQP